MYANCQNFFALKVSACNVLCFSSQSALAVFLKVVSMTVMLMLSIAVSVFAAIFRFDERHSEVWEDSI